MRVLIIGQCQGGNAKTWEGFLNNYTELDLIHYVCRNYSQADFKLKTKNQKVFKLYNYFKGWGLLEKIWIKIMSSYIFPIIIKLLDVFYKYDVIHIQGNYAPKFNLSLMNVVKAKKVMHIYGSDFYQKYINGNEKSKSNFEEVIKQSDHVLFNFETLKNDFLKEINCSEKVSVGCMGVSDFWSKAYNEKSSNDNVIRILSARGMYFYNNVSFLVDSFIEIYGGNPKFELYLVNGYGWDEDEKNAVMEKIKNYNNIIARVGEWISDEELRYYYDLCDYNFCIGSTDQLTVSIVYGYLRKSLNVLSPLENYSELDELQFKSHTYLQDISKESVDNLLKSLPKKDNNILNEDRIKAEENFLFRNRFKNTLRVYKNLTE
ncbi:hypothetical protein BTO06_02940 [Tenacibaculum sp. SZ-18]|uniref:hypothetical protein n=1 Tax=Tenacibaculum sp. SZ-18 TaxID=754423 RepID=UPI000C2D59DF|nr:hypothetical protein [Tenacibaculum sp. SZ-18]AUC14167.1 hypothetical protein BTO06_02940 [Tenacibaculum sp. SZ-18]